MIGESVATILETTIRQHNQTRYSSTNLSVTQYDINSKILCAAQCARLISTCNIAVFNPLAIPSCSLYGESLMIANLVLDSKATTFHFGRNIISHGCLSSAGMTTLSTYSIITVHELNIDSDVYGPIMICGSFLSSASVNFIRGLDPNAFPVANYGLEIHGQITSGSTIKVYAGSLAVSTNFSRTIAASNNKTYTVDGRLFDIEEGNRGASVKIDPNMTDRCITVENDLRTLSSQLTNLANISGNNISIPTTVSAPLTFYVNQVDANGMAAFYINGNTALNNPFAQNIEVVIDSGINSIVQLVVINLLGTTLTHGQGNMGGTWLTSAVGQSKTIWNFKQATTITLNRRWMGAFLAPDASVNTNSEIDGAIAVHCLISTAKVNAPLLLKPSCV